MNDRLTHIDLFAGIGGFSLASRWAGFRTIAFCEKDEWCQKVLAKNFGAEVVSNSNEPRLEGLPTGGEQGIRSRPERRGSIPLYPDIRTFPGHLYRGATLLTGGFPCQPFSCAGKQQGKADDRDLWPFMFAVIKVARPTWIVGENVAGFVKMELDRSISDLESEGYSVRTFIIPACAVGAFHRRSRVWIVGHAEHTGLNATEIPGSIGTGNDNIKAGAEQGGEPEGSDTRIVAHPERNGRRRWRNGDETRNNGQIQTAGSRPADQCEDVADSNSQGLQRNILKNRREGSQSSNEQPVRCNRTSGFCEWPVEPKLGRVAHGIPRRVDRLKGLGNAIVPKNAYEIINALARVEREGKGMDGQKTMEKSVALVSMDAAFC